MLTEAEAKTKACPLTFCITGGSFGGGSIMPGPRNCIGSACMAWRWVDANSVNPGNSAHPIIYEDRMHTYGFCGAFARPQ